MTILFGNCVCIVNGHYIRLELLFGLTTNILSGRMSHASFPFHSEIYDILARARINFKMQWVQPSKKQGRQRQSLNRKNRKKAERGRWMIPLSSYMKRQECYRMTHHVVLMVLLTSNQKLRCSIKRIYWNTIFFHVVWTNDTTWCVYLYFQSRNYDRILLLCSLLQLSTLYSHTWNFRITALPYNPKLELEPPWELSVFQPPNNSWILSLSHCRLPQSRWRSPRRCGRWSRSWWTRSTPMCDTSRSSWRSSPWFHVAYLL